MAKFDKSVFSRNFSSHRLDNWEAVSKLLELCSLYGRDWLFRGVSDSSYLLIPKVGRDTRKVNQRSKKRIPYLREDEIAAFAFFKSRARALVSDSSKTELEWLALAQHHGVPTRLLDWSEGLLVGLWFATASSSGQTNGDGALWITWDLSPTTPQAHANPFGKTKIGIYRPDYIDRRIAAQQSVFTLQPDPTKELSLTNTVKFVIPRKSKFLLRKRIDAAGINERTLFPDLAGLGADVAWRYKNNYIGKYGPTETD